MDKFFLCIKQKICSECLNTLKNISYDKENQVFLCNCDTKRIDFDKLTDKYCPHPNPPSVDTIIFNKIDKKIYLIEFKNQKCSNINNEEIKRKVESSINVLKDLAKKCNVNFKDYLIYVGIVYNDKSKWKRGICSNTIQFGLEYFKEQGLIKDVKTNDIDWFKKLYERKNNNFL